MSAEFSKGPWEFGKQGRYRVRIDAANSRFCWGDLARVVNRGEHGLNDPEGTANANLIRTAPELYEYVESSASNGCATAQALIAKARGQ